MTLILDQVVIDFLREHGVDCSPPAGPSALDNALRGAMTGAAGIVGGGMLHLEHNQ